MKLYWIESPTLDAFSRKMLKLALWKWEENVEEEHLILEFFFLFVFPLVSVLCFLVVGSCFGVIVKAAVQLTTVSHEESVVFPVI